MRANTMHHLDAISPEIQQLHSTISQDSRSVHSGSLAGNFIHYAMPKRQASNRARSSSPVKACYLATFDRIDRCGQLRVVFLEGSFLAIGGGRLRAANRMGTKA